LRNENDWQVLCLPGVKQEDAPQVMRAAHVSGLRVGSIPGICTLYSQPVSPWEEYFAARTGHFRKRFKAAERALDALGVVRFETITDEKRLANVLEEVFDLAKASWKETAQKTSDVHLPLTEEARTFYRALSAAYAAIEGCQVVTIRIEGALVAAMLSIVADDRLYLLQTYYAPAVAGASPGRFLIREVIKWAAHHGIAWIDMNGNSGLVKMFADTAQTYDQFFVFRSDRYPNWLHRVGSVVERLRGAPAHTA
jgi:CelD/BcsL family acetyltransferase involved in cellulose biosynthesis